MSFFIVEGANGSGKTTLVNKLKQIDGCRSFSSPNGTKLANAVRPMARGTDEWHTLSAMVKFLLFSAARYDEYMNLVHGQPKDSLIVCDRWWTSTLIYQCYAGNIAQSALEETIHPEEELTGVILLDAPDEVLWERANNERMANAKHGVCSWTGDQAVAKNIASLYRGKFVKYLIDKKIPYVKIDVSKYDTDGVFNQSLSFINSEREKNGCSKIAQEDRFKA